MENLATIAFETNANILTELLPNLATDKAISNQPVKSQSNYVQERSKSRTISHAENANQKKLHPPKKTEARKSITKKTE